MPPRVTLFLVAAVVALGGGLAGTQERRQQTPTIRIDSLAGVDSFSLYCASCHGEGGGGDGPVAPTLRDRPADLTLLAQRARGAFPRDLVRAAITGAGTATAAHGSATMPVWGPIFRAFESDARVRERIDNLVEHVASLQRPTTLPGDPGAQAFRTYCATCHGTSGRGNGPMAGSLRQVPPDLTQFTTRNGGVFPLGRLTRIIDGRDVRAHGDREMPVWGDAFRTGAGSLSPGEVRARIEAIVRYLQGIQERPA